MEWTEQNRNISSSSSGSSRQSSSGREAAAERQRQRQWQSDIFSIQLSITYDIHSQLSGRTKIAERLSTRLARCRCCCCCCLPPASAPSLAHCPRFCHQSRKMSSERTNQQTNKQTTDGQTEAGWQTLTRLLEAGAAGHTRRMCNILWVVSVVTH